MHYLKFLTHRSLVGSAIALALSVIAPQTVLADGTDVGYAWHGSTQAMQGSYNSAYGYSVLFYNTGVDNTGVGAQSLFSNTSGSNNTASGVNALYANSTGHENTATGVNALYLNSAGYFNTASGVNALYYNTNGVMNTANGAYSLFSNSTGNYNTAIGLSSLYSNNGSNNTAVGDQALYNNTSGVYNIAVGAGAGASITTGNYNIDIGSNGYPGDSATIRIGNGNQTKAFIAGISNVNVAGAQVVVSASGQLGIVQSSQRFKKDIKSIDSISDKLLQLRPVSFIYKEDDKNQVQYGLIAEEVAKVYPELVQYDAEGKPFTVYYHLLTPLLLSEVQKEHQKVIAQEEQVASLNQQLNAQHAEMLAMLKQQQQQHEIEMAAMQQKLNRLDDLLQANSSKAGPSEKVALVDNH